MLWGGGGVNQIERSGRLRRLQRVAVFAVALLMAKVLLQILAEYRWYFPANFEAAFLIGREDSFAGLYRIAFYAHVISGPLAILLGSCLMFSGGRPRRRRLHRLAGRLQLLVVLGFVVPSGLVMAPRSMAGPVAAYGFAILSVATGITFVAAIYFAIHRRFDLHQRWATRCYLLLCSPLLLRLISGATIVTNTEADWIYRINAWVSWLIPLTIYETWWRSTARRGSTLPAANPSSTSREAWL
jgi:hypothetical protein